MANPQLKNGYVCIANEIFDCFQRFRIPGQVRQVVDAIIRHTYGWQKKYAKIRNRDFVLKTGLKKSDVCDALKKAETHHLISRNDAGEWCLEKDYDKWLEFGGNKRLHKDLTFPEDLTAVPHNPNVLYPNSLTSADGLKTIKTYKDKTTSSSKGRHIASTPPECCRPPFSICYRSL